MMETRTRGKRTIDRRLQGSKGTLVDMNSTRLSKRSQGCPLTVEEILNSRWHRRRFQFLVKWKGFGREHNSWEVASNVKAPDLVAEYYWKHPATPRHIRQTDFDAIFNPRTIASRRSNLGGGVNVKGPLTHDPEVPSVASQHNFIVQPLVTKEWNARAF